MEKTTKREPLTPPSTSKPGTIAMKIERALEVRRSTAKAREGKPMAFPTGRQRP